MANGEITPAGLLHAAPTCLGRMSGVHGEMSPGQSCKSRWRETFGLSRDIPSLTHPVVCVCWGSLQKVLMLIHGAFNEAQRPAPTASVVGEVMGRRARPCCKKKLARISNEQTLARGCNQAKRGKTACYPRESRDDNAKMTARHRGNWTARRPGLDKVQYPHLEMGAAAPAPRAVVALLARVIGSYVDRWRRAARRHHRPWWGEEEEKKDRGNSSADCSASPKHSSQCRLPFSVICKGGNYPYLRLRKTTAGKWL